MRRLIDILNEVKNKPSTPEDTLSAKKGEEKKAPTPTFVDDDPNVPFPNDTMSTLKKTINKASKDLSKDWKNGIEVVDFAFDELEIDKPLAYLKERWKQYNTLVSVAVQNLHDSRGLK